MIPLANPKAQYMAHKDEIDSAVKRVLDSGWYILGREVELFEIEWARYLGVNYAIGVGSGTEALHLALRVCGIGQGDEVITVSHTAVATIAAIELAGANPVFVDINPDTYTIDTNAILEAITEKTKAVIPVHIYGHPAEMSKILAVAKKQKLYVIEDCAQAHGAEYNGKKVGSLGDIGCFSFYPTKNLGALGDGGALVTNNRNLKERALLLREYGWKERYISKIQGWNTRLDEIQAAILRVKLKYLDQDNAARQKLAKLYRNGLRDMAITLPKERKDCSHVHHLFVIRNTMRNDLMKRMQSQNIGVGIHYPLPVHMQPAYLRIGGSYPNTERISHEILSLPIYPELNEGEIIKVINAIKKAV